jgi:membrane protein DedA with SNARE-associated domain
MNVTHIINAYGYWAVFLFVAVESLGIPVPGETALIAAGAYAGHTHRLSGWVIFAVASAGAMVGDNIGFWAGDKGGYRLARKYGHRIRLDERKLMIGRYVFDSYGPKVVFFGRFVSILRTYAAFLAGTSKMRWRRFWPANAAGGIVWAGMFTVVAYVAGNTLIHLSGTIDVAVGGVALLAVATGLLVIRQHIGTLAVRAEAAYTDHADDEAPRSTAQVAGAVNPVRGAAWR